MNLEFQEHPTDPKFQDLTNHTFHRLKVLGYAGYVQRGSQRVTSWYCQCRCAKVIQVTSGHLKSGHTKSCGCLKLDTILKNRHDPTKHGLSRTPEYKSWYSMMSRCYNPNDGNYERWGGRGIRVCQRWHNIENFYEDMAPRPSPDHSIDRIDNDGHYSCGKCDECRENGWPANCRWATITQQMNNRGDYNVHMTLNGITQTASQWSRVVGIPVGTILQRKHCGWSDERALTTPVRKHK